MEIRRRKRELGRPIDNPVRHALEKTGYECKLLSVTHPWQPHMTFHTTGRFSRSDRSYHKNCGPTAITNLLDAAAARCGREDLLRLSPEEIFRRVAAIGRHRAAYWSIRDPIPLGGTSYAMLGNYIHTCLYRFGLGDRIRLSGRLLSSARDMAREIRQDSLLILSLYRHPYYGSHIVVAYGVVEVAVAGRAAPRLYLEVADGWTSRPRYIAAEDLKHCGYVAVTLR